MIKIGCGKTRLPNGSEAPWSIVKTLSGYVHIIRIEHTVDEPRSHISSSQSGYFLSDMLQKFCGRVVGFYTAIKMRETVIDQLAH